MKEKSKKARGNGEIEGGHGANETSPLKNEKDIQITDPEVLDRPVRRRFSAGNSSDHHQLSFEVS